MKPGNRIRGKRSDQDTIQGGENGNNKAVPEINRKRPFRENAHIVVKGGVLWNEIESPVAKQLERRLDRSDKLPKKRKQNDDQHCGDKKIKKESISFFLHPRFPL